MRPLLVEAERAARRPAFRYEAERVLGAIERLVEIGDGADLDEQERSAWVSCSLRAAGIRLRLGDGSSAKIWLARAEKALGRDPVARAEWLVLHARVDIWAPAHDEAGAPGGPGSLAWRSLDDARHACAGLPERSGVHRRLMLAYAEQLALSERHDRIPMLLEGYVRTPGGFDRVDDRWRALWLLARARREAGRFDEAAAAFAEVATLCRAHEAPDDEADARIAQGRSLFGAGRPDEGMNLIRSTRARIAADSPAFSDAAAADVLATMASGDLDTVASVARSCALEAVAAGDGRVYLASLEIVVHIYRARRQYELALRLLLTVYSHLVGSAGVDRARPVLALIDTIEGDLGAVAFEALSARLLTTVQ